MNNAILIRTPGTVTTPLPGAPKLLDPTIDPYVEIDVDLLVEQFAEGALVDQIVAPGAGSAAWRTFANKNPVFTFPTIKHNATPTGKAALVFAGSQQLYQASSNGWNPETIPPLPMCTTALVLKVTNWDGLDATARFVGGAAGYLSNIQPSPSVPGNIQFSAGSIVSRALPGDNDAWVVLIFSQNSEGVDLIKVDTLPVEEINAGNQGAALMSFGSSGALGGTAGGEGSYELAYAIKLAWALNAAEMAVLDAVLRSKYIGAV